MAAAAAMIGIGTAHADTPSDVLLTSSDPNDALVLIPAENQEYADVANALYLEPNGFDGDGLTDYYTIDNSNVNDLEASYNQFLLALDIVPSNVTTDASATAATDLATSASSASATPDDVIGQAIADLNQGTSVLDAAPTADLSARQADILADTESLNTELDSPLSQMATLQDGFSPADQTYFGQRRRTACHRRYEHALSRLGVCRR